MEFYNVLKKDLIPSDIQIVPFGYKAKKGENVFQAYIGGEIPIMLMSKSFTEDEFKKICID